MGPDNFLKADNFVNHLFFVPEILEQIKENFFVMLAARGCLVNQMGNNPIGFHAQR